MFEDSLMESGGKLKTKSKYWSIATFAINGLILAALIIWPLLHPEALPTQMMATLLVTPPPQAPVQVKIKSEMLDNQLQAPSKIPKEIKQIKESAAPPSMAGVSGMEGMGGGTPGGVMGGILGGLGTGPAPKVQAATPKKVAVSSGVMAGNRIGGENPTYPAIAKAARIQGTVVLQATISKNGTIENLRVIGGPPMLQSAATEAVRGWRYKPYLLNGEPVEVETQVNVVFSLGS
jgi:protein TonB